VNKESEAFTLKSQAELVKPSLKTLLDAVLSKCAGETFFIETVLQKSPDRQTVFCDLISFRKYL
jgi:hypothetical protein